MMMVIEPGKLSGRIRAIASKSDAHRQLIAAALSTRSSGTTQLVMGSSCEDIEATTRCLAGLGAVIEKNIDGLCVTPIRSVPSDSIALDVGESGSTLRFLLPLCAALGADATLTARGSLTERPNAHLIEQLRAHGITVQGEAPPLSLSGKLQPGVYQLPGNVSSQYATGLLFALPLLDGPSEIRFTSAVESKAYIDLTVGVLALYGVRIEQTESGYKIPAPQPYQSPDRIEVEGDWSNAAFFLAANALGSHVQLDGLTDASAQGDRFISELLQTLATPGPHVIDASGAPDLVPILSVVATQMQGETRITGAARLRLKESDRLMAMRHCLSTLGADIQETPDGLIIQGGSPLHGGKVPAFNDHRIAMAMAIAGTITAGPVEIDGAECVAKSYPTFFEDFVKLGGVAHVKHGGE